MPKGCSPWGMLLMPLSGLVLVMAGGYGVLIASR